MSNNIFKPNRPDGNQDKQQVPQQAPATSGINIELLDKVGALSTTLPSNGSSLVSAAKV